LLLSDLSLSMHAKRTNQQILFDHLISEFGETGTDAVAFLKTGEALARSRVPTLPRRAAAAAYCLREALKRLLPPEPDLWGALTQDVLDAKTRFETVRDLPGADHVGALDDLLTAIGRMEDFKRTNEGKNVRRLGGLIEARTGTFLFAFALKEYQDVLRQLDAVGVHGSISIAQARELSSRALAVLMLIFGPFEARQAELDALAQLEDPAESDVARLLSVCSGPHHLSYFMRRAMSPKWLELLTPSGILDPPRQGQLWAAAILVERLAPEHGAAVATWLDRIYTSCAKTEVRAGYIVMAARHSLPNSSRPLLRALQDYPSSQWIRGEAVIALGTMEASSDFVEKVAAVILKSAQDQATNDFSGEAADALLAGLGAKNALRRIQLLAGGLAASAETRLLLTPLSPAGSIEQIAEIEGREAGRLLKALLAAIRLAREFTPATSELNAVFDGLPAGLRSRLRVWTLRHALDASTEERVLEIASAIRDRSPNAEDLLLIDEITSQEASSLWAGPWIEALGAAPKPEEIGRALAASDVPIEWRRVARWYEILPANVRDVWGTAAALMAPTLPSPSRDAYLEAPRGLEFDSARSPFTKAELASLDVSEAAQRISGWRPTGDHLTLARELGRTLEELVSESPQRWAEKPLETVALLRHPTYIHHYFAGLAKASSDLGGLGPGIIEAITVAMTHPWSVVTLGADDFDYDQSWTPVDEECLDLIGRLAERDVDLGSRYDDAWAPVIRAVRDRATASRISRHKDPLETAINRPCTRALQSIFHLMGADFRRERLIRDEALAVLDEALALSGWDGAEHRAIIAPRLSFLLHVAPDWVERRASDLFGKSAPSGLGQQTVDLALKWGRPNRWLLERYRPLLLHAVRAESDRAMDHLMVAMLWAIPGFSVSEVVTLLVQMGAERLSKAGESLARLLHPDPDPGHLEIGIAFWEEALVIAKRPTLALRGFGWWADVEKLGQTKWEALTLTTCDRAKGNLALSHKVAERAATAPVTNIGLSILTSLVRGQHEYWDRSHIAEIALSALAATMDEPTLGPVRDKLRTALNDYGYFER
jgi:hypothetical protein